MQTIRCGPFPFMREAVAAGCRLADWVWLALFHRIGSGELARMDHDQVEHRSDGDVGARDLQERPVPSGNILEPAVPRTLRDAITDPVEACVGNQKAHAYGDEKAGDQ